MPARNDDMLSRRATLQPTTFNEADRTVEAVISRGSPVRRRDQRGEFIERLDLNAIDPAALVGIPVLDSHRQGSTRDVVGIVKAARREAGALYATIRFSHRDDVEPLVRDVRDGILPSVSIGSTADRWRETTDPETGERTRVAVSWAIREVSFVPLGADPAARIRKAPAMENETEVIESPAITTSDAPQPATEAEVRAMGELADLQPSAVEAILARNLPVTEARAAVREAMQQRQAPARTIRVQPGVDHTDPAALLTRRVDALVARLNGMAPPEAARPFYHDTLAGHAAGLLMARGERLSAGTSPEAILTRAAQHTTGDFPALLTGTGNRILMGAYEAAPNPLKRLARRTTRPDFRPGSTLRVGEMGTLGRVPQSGEITATTRGESVESYGVDTYARLFSLSRHATINDDLGAFRDWSVAAGQAAAETEAGLLVELLTQAGGAGPVMNDGQRLFHASHGNLAAAPCHLGDFGSLSDARMGMRLQKGQDGVTPISAVPKFLLVGPALETTAEQLLSTIYPIAAADIQDNVFAGKLELLVEARLPETWAFYVFADPAVLPVLEYAYLSSAPGPQMASREGWDVLGQEFRVVLDFGCGAIDWRGAYRNAGDTPDTA